MALFSHLFRARFAGFGALAGLAAILTIPSGVAQGQTFTSSGAITVNGTGVSTPYPTSPAASCSSNAACLSVSGLTGTINTVTLTLNSFNVANNNDVTLMLEAPDGTDFDLLSATCNVQNVSFTLSDGGTGLIPTFPGGAGACSPAISNGVTLKPTNYAGVGADTFTSPAVTSPNTAANSATTTGTATFFSQFHGRSGNGVWRLYVVTEFGGPPTASGSIGSWALTFTVNVGAATTTTLSLQSGTNPSFTAAPNNSVTFRATVSSTSTVNDGTVSYTNNGAALSCGAGSSTQVTGGIFDCVTSLTSEGDHAIIATYGGGTGFASSAPSNTLTQTAVNHTHQTSNSYCNDHTTLTIPLTSHASSPFPSDVFVGAPDATTSPSGGGIIEKITINLNSLTYGNASVGPQDLGFMLVGPNGKAFSFMSLAGDNASVSNLSVTLDDDAVTALQSGIGLNPTNGGTYRPGDFKSLYGVADEYVSPAPGVFDAAAPTGSSTFLTEFGGSTPAGTWKLFLDNRGANAAGGSLGSWCINFTMTAGTPTTTTLTSTVGGVPKNPALTTDAILLTATVTSGSTVNGGTVTFSEGVTTYGTGTVASGTATLLTATLAQGTHNIVASYGGTASFGPSTGNLVQRVDRPTLDYAPATNTYSFCNPGAITIPATGTNPNPAGPYPANIFIGALPGLIDNVALSLNGLVFIEPVHIQSLLVGPVGNSGTNIDFFSNAGGVGNILAPGIDVTFDDVLGSPFPGALTASGTFKTISNTGAHTFPACPPNITCGSLGPPAPTSGYQFANPVGSTTLHGQYTGLNGNGTWSLYMQTNLQGADGAISGDTGAPAGTAARNPFCLSFTVNPPVLSVTRTLPNFTQGQVGATYTTHVANSGPGPTGDPTGTNPVAVTDAPPVGFTVTAINGTNWNCIQPSGPCRRSDPLAALSSYDDITVTVNVASNAPSGNSGTAQASGGGTGTASSNNTFTVLPAPGLSVAKGHTGTFTQGQTGEWDVTVSNTLAGSTTTGTVTLVDTLPNNYALNSYSSAGNAWTCGSVTVTVTCTATTAVAGGSSFATLQLIANIPAGSPLSVTNNVGAYGGGDLVHVNLPNAVAASDIVTVIQAAATITTTTGTPQSVVFANAFAALTATVLDGSSNPVNNVTVTFTAPASGPSVVFTSSGTNVVTGSTNSSGIATSGALTANSTVGPQYTVAATVSGVVTAANFLLTNTAGAAASITATWGTPQSATVNTDFATKLQATVKDSGNHGVPNITVTFSPPGSGASGSFAGNVNTAVTDGSGVATSAIFTANTVAGSYNVGASAPSAGSTNFALANTSGLPASVSPTAGTPQSTTVSTAFATALQGVVKDQFNNLVPNASVTFTAPTSGATGTFPGPSNFATVNADALGVATAPIFIANATPGGYSVAASSGAATTASYSLTNSANSTTGFITGFALNSPPLRNNFSGFAGMKLTVGPLPLTVTSVGRICVAGNSGTHTVKFVDAGTAVDVVGGSASVNMAGCTPGQFVYAALPGSLPLHASSNYYLASQEVMGGDQFYNHGNISSTLVAAVKSSIYFDGSHWIPLDTANTSYVPPNFLYVTSPPDPTPPFVLEYNLNDAPLRNNFSGFTGMKLTVGPSSLMVASMGRICVAGNTGIHTVKFVNTATLTDVPGGSVAVNMAGCAVGQFTYASLAIPVNLQAGSSYFLVSQEAMGGDQWYDHGTLISTTDAAVNTSIFFEGANWIPANGTNASYVPPNFKYSIVSSTVQVTVQTNIAGPAFSVDGTTYTTPQLFVWVNGSSHTIATTNPQSVGVGSRYFWNNWSDSGLISHSVSPTVNTTYTANFTTQFLLTASVSPGGGGTVNTNPPSLLADGYYNIGTSVQLTAAPAGGFSFFNWTGDLSGAINPQSLTMSALHSATANFQVVPSSTFVVGFALNSPPQRNNFNGFMGMKLTIGANPLNVSALGRICVAGNSAAHTVKFVRVGPLMDVGSVSVNMAGCTPGQFVYTNLGSAITLQANAQYYLASQETSGGDKFYDHGTLSTTGVAAVNNSVFFDGTNWNQVDVANTSYIPPDFKYTVQPPDTTPPFIIDYNLNARPLRNNFTGLIGTKLTVGASALTVSQVGRACIAGNSQTHTVELVTVTTGLVVPGAAASVNMAGCTAGQFVYTTLGSPVSLLAGTSYYLVSQETNGGDQWYDHGTLTTTSAASVLNSIYFNGTSWISIDNTNTSYVPPNFKYQ